LKVAWNGASPTVRARFASTPGVKDLIGEVIRSMHTEERKALIDDARLAE
jgi:hypothetical protein